MNRVNNSSFKKNKKEEKKKNKINKKGVATYDIDGNTITIKESKEAKLAEKQNRKKEKKRKNNHEKELKKMNKKNKVKKKHPILRLFWNIFLVLLVFIIVLGALFYQQVLKNGGGVQGALCTLFGQSVDDLNKLEPINVLLLGVSEDIDSELTDTIIVCNYNPKTQKVVMLSIPRDTFIGSNPAQAKGSDKINALYRKGVNKTLKAVNDITDLDIKYYIVVKNTSLINIVDILGGIDFEVPINMNYDDPTQDLHIHLTQGMQRIDGEKAEQLLRFRHNNDMTSYPSSYGDNDFGRMKTQRNFIKETIRQTLRPQNVLKSKIIYHEVMNNIETNLDKDTIYSYIPKAANFNTENIISIQLPGEPKMFNNLSFFNYHKKEAKKLISENFNQK